MEVIGIQTPLIKPGDDLVEVILDSIGQDVGLKNQDILVIASSVVSTVNNRVKKISDVEPSGKAEELSEESGLDPRFVEIIIQESDEILNPFEDCILTLKDDMLRINAGVDRSNVPSGYALLLPKNPDKQAEQLREKFEKKTGKKLGVIIVDSHVHPLRRGTTGQALGTSGLRTTIDCRNQKDLYGRNLKITFRGIADQLAAAAQLVMGEADESIPAVIISGADMAFSDKTEKSSRIPPEECVYSKFFNWINNKQK